MTASARLVEGAVATLDFVVTTVDMEAFRSLSGDSSSIHTDPVFARSRGYSEVIVYGGIVLAKLSRLLGAELPGDKGTSAHWRIDFRRPLYVGETASLRLEVVRVSPATGLIESRFTVRAGDRLVATGRTQSVVPLTSLERMGDGGREHAV